MFFFERTAGASLTQPTWGTLPRIPSPKSVRAPILRESGSVKVTENEGRATIWKWMGAFVAAMIFHFTANSKQLMQCAAGSRFKSKPGWNGQDAALTESWAWHRVSGLPAFLASEVKSWSRKFFKQKACAWMRTFESALSKDFYFSHFYSSQSDQSINLWYILRKIQAKDKLRMIDTKMKLSTNNHSIIMALTSTKIHKDDGCLPTDWRSNQILAASILIILCGRNPFLWIMTSEKKCRSVSDHYSSRDCNFPCQMNSALAQALLGASISTSLLMQRLTITMPWLRFMFNLRDGFCAKREKNTLGRLDLSHWDDCGVC